MLQKRDYQQRQSRPPLGSNAEEVRRGSHASFAYSTVDELRPMVARYVATGLDHGERCIYMLGDRNVIELVDWLDEGGIDVPKHAADGSLQILRAKQVYLRDGGFDPRAVIETVRAAVQRAMHDGFSGLRAAGDMTWALGGTPLARLIDYEREVDRTLFTDRRLTGLCLYDDRRFGWEQIAALNAVHRMVVRPPSRDGGHHDIHG